MKTQIALIALAVMASVPAYATSKDCGCTKTPTAYDKTQDVKISGNSAAIGDVKLTAGQAFDIAVEGRATAGNALTTVYGLIPQVNNNAKGIEDLRNTKVDKSVFTADQQRQDKALASTVAAQAGRDAGQDEHINAVQTVAQNASVHADELAVRADGIEQRATVTDNRSINNAVRLDGAEQGIRDGVAQADIDRAAQVDGDRMLGGRIDKESDTRARQVVQLAAGIDNAQATGDYAASRADMAFSNAAANSQAIRKTNATVAEHSATLQNHEQRIGDLEKSNASKFASIDKRFGEVKDHASAGAASAFAQANIPQVMSSGEFGIGAGVGSYSNQQAVAVGASYAPQQNVVIKATVSTDTMHNFGAGAGMMVSFR